MILIGMHFGAIELPIVFVSNLVGRNVTAPMETVSDPGLQHWFVTSRSRVGVNIVPIRNARRTLLAAIRRGESVGLVADRDLAGSGILVPFFGHPAPIPAGPAILALETGAPMWVAAAMRTKDGRYRGRVVHVPTPEGGIPPRAGHGDDHRRWSRRSRTCSAMHPNSGGARSTRSGRISRSIGAPDAPATERARGRGGRMTRGPVDRRGRADLHIHTLASDGTASVVEILDHVAAAGFLDLIAIADHERIDAALAARALAADRGLAVRGRRRRGDHDARRSPRRPVPRGARPAAQEPPLVDRGDPRPGWDRDPGAPARPAPPVRAGLGPAAPAGRRQ